MFLHCVSPKYILEWFVVTGIGSVKFGKGLRWEPWRFADRAVILSTFLDFKEIMPLPTTVLQECLQTLSYFSSWYLIRMSKLKLSITFLQLGPQGIDLMVRGSHIHNKLPALQFKSLRYAGKDGEMASRTASFTAGFFRANSLSYPRLLQFSTNFSSLSGS